MDFSFTGNPLIDTGLCAMAAYMGVSDPRQIDVESLRSKVATGELARWTARLKSVTMVFTSNGPLTNSSAQYDKSRLFTELTSIALSHEVPLAKDICDYCGAQAVDFDAMWARAAGAAGANERAKALGRDIVPLSGAPGNAAQVLPCASRTLALCPRCLAAVSFLPIGLRLISGKLAALEAVNQPLAFRFVTSVVRRNVAELQSGDTKVANLGSKQRPSHVVEFLATLMAEGQVSGDSPETARPLHIWLFTNAGQSSECEMVTLPNFALRFLADAMELGYSRDVVLLCSTDRGQSLLTDIATGRVPRRIWPDPKVPFSLGFRLLYLNRVARIAPGAIGLAYSLAERIRAAMSDDELANLRKAGRDARRLRDIMRRQAALAALKGEVTHAQWAALATRADEPRQFDWTATDLVRLFLCHPGEEPAYDELEEVCAMRQPHPLIDRAAAAYGDWYIENRGIERLKKDILGRFERGELRLGWLKEVFARLAETDEGFDVEDWDEFIHDSDGNDVTDELLFQMRLRLANLYRQRQMEE